MWLQSRALADYDCIKIANGIGSLLQSYFHLPEKLEA